MSEISFAFSLYSYIYSMYRQTKKNTTTATNNNSASIKKNKTYFNWIGRARSSTNVRLPILCLFAPPSSSYIILYMYIRYSNIYVACHRRKKKSKQTNRLTDKGAVSGSAQQPSSAAANQQLAAQQQTVRTHQVYKNHTLCYAARTCVVDGAYL